MTGIIYAWCVQGVIWGLGATADEAEAEAIRMATVRAGMLPGLVSLAEAQRWVMGGSAIRMEGDPRQVTALLAQVGAPMPVVGVAA